MSSDRRRDGFSFVSVTLAVNTVSKASHHRQTMSLFAAPLPDSFENLTLGRFAARQSAGSR